MIRRALLIVFTIVVVLFPFSQKTFAQATGAADVSIELIPAHPGPYTPVTIKISSYSVSIPSSLVQWTIDGKAGPSGFGYARYGFTTKGPGQTTAIRVTVTPVGSAPMTRSVSITPQSVDILWEATDSNVPPLYRGKALATSESAVKFVAMPQIRSVGGSLIAPGTFFYDWKEEYTPEQSKSGYAKESFRTSMDKLNPTKHINLDILTRDGNVSASTEKILGSSEPAFAWYIDSPLYGPLYDHALLGNYKVTDSDISILAEPFFFSPKNATASQIKYAWKLNGNTINPPSIPNVLSLHRNSGDKGDAKIDLSVINETKLFQELRSSLVLSLN